MSFEEILETISQYWALFITTGAYGLIMTYGVVFIRGLLTKATTSKIVNKFIDGIGGTLSFLKEQANLTYTKLQRLFQRVQSLQNEVEVLKGTLGDMYLKVDAFMQAILTADGQEQVLQSYNSIMENVKPVLEAKGIEPEIEVVEEPVKEEVVVEEPKKTKKQKKQKNKEVIEYVEELY